MKENVKFNKNLIDTIIQAQDECVRLWREKCEKDNRSLFNQSTTNVCDIASKINASECIVEYQSFLVANMLDSQLGKGYDNFRTRIKSRNSIENKISRYIDSSQMGRSAVKKCLNDIFGCRIVTDRPYSYDEIKDLIREWYGNSIRVRVRVIDSTKVKTNYVGTHIYFHVDNFNFDWELQIWDAEHVESNEDSHKAYKQDYVKWEDIVSHKEDGAL